MSPRIPDRREPDDGRNKSTAILFREHLNEYLMPWDDT